MMEDNIELSGTQRVRNTGVAQEVKINKFKTWITTLILLTSVTFEAI